MKRKLFFIAGMALGLAAVSSCKDDPEEFAPVPGVDAQLKAPQDFAAKVMGTTVKFAWRAHSNAVGFEVQLSTDEAFTAPETYTVDKASCTVEALRVRTAYRARVKAIAKEASQSSGFSEPIELTTGDENIMKATPKELLDTAVTLQWEAGAAVTHLLATPDGGEALPPYAITDNEKAMGEKTLTGLAPEVTYSVMLYNGENVRGEGEYATLPLILPPLDVALVKSAPDSLYLSWASGELLSHFVLTPAPVEGSDTLRLSDGAQSVALGGLVPGTEYSFAAFYGNSVRGSSAFATDTLLANVVVAVSDITTATATVSWAGGGKYVSRLSFTPAIPAVDVTADDSSGKAITSLTSNTEYTVTLEYVYAGIAYVRGVQVFSTLDGTLPPPKETHVPAGANLKDSLDVAGNRDILVLDGSDYVLDNYTLKPNMEIAIRGANPSSKSKLHHSATGVVFTLAEGATLRLENLELDGGRIVATSGGDYFINHSSAVNFNAITFENCYIHNFGRSVVRINHAEAKIDSVRMNNCIFQILGDNGNYSIVQTNTTGSRVNNVQITNSTMNDVYGGVFYNNGGQLFNSFVLQNCTFYDVFVHQNQSLLRTGDAAQPTVSVVQGLIIGKIKKNDNPKVRLYDIGATNGRPTTFSDNYKTNAPTDSIDANYDMAVEYVGTSDALFTNPATGDFTIKDADFAGKNTAGDPRWRGEGSTPPPVGDGDTPGTILNGYYVITDGEYFQTTSANIASTEWVTYTTNNYADRTKCYSGNVPNLSQAARIVTFKVKGATSFTVQADGNGSRTLTYTINGGSPITSKTYINGCDTEDVSTGTTGECTIEIAGDGSGSVYLHGITFHK